MHSNNYRTNEEVWKPIPGFEQTYEVSNFGNVRSLSRWTKFGMQEKFVQGRVLAPKRRKGKYSTFILSQDNVQTTHMIHRLVASAFLPNESNLPVVNHKDGNKENNHVANLEWCTYSHNIRHAFSNGLMVCKTAEWFKADPSRRQAVSDRFKGRKNHMFILLTDDQQRYIIELRRAGHSMDAIRKKINEKFNISLKGNNPIRRTCNEFNIHPDRVISKGHKIDRDAIVEIRNMHKSGIPIKDLGLKYGISQGMVYNIINFRSWKHVS